MNTRTYQTEAGLGKTSQAVREFGERQNALNTKLLEKIRSLEARNQALTRQLDEASMRITELEVTTEAVLERLAALEQEQALNIRRFGRCAADLDTVEKEVDRLKLTAKLNSNAIDRLSKK